MIAETVIEHCRADGLAVSIVDGQLVVTGAPDAIDSWRSVLKEHKNELLAYLANHRPALYTMRVQQVHQLGLSEGDAESIASRLELRDAQHDERRMCLECAHLYGAITARRCANRSAPTASGQAIPVDLVDVLQRCRGFALSPQLT